MTAESSKAYVSHFDSRIAAGDTIVTLRKTSGQVEKYHCSSISYELPNSYLACELAEPGRHKVIVFDLEVDEIRKY